MQKQQGLCVENSKLVKDNDMKKCVFKRFPPFSSSLQWSIRMTPTKVNRKTCEWLITKNGVEIGMIKYHWNRREYLFEFTNNDTGLWEWRDFDAITRKLENLMEEYNPQKIEEFPVNNCV